MNYLFIIAHPDDESNASGGSIFKLVKEGNKVAVAIMAKSASARKNLSLSLSSEEEEVMNFLGVCKVYHADFPNIKMNTVPHLELVQYIENCIEDFEAEAIITHHPTDVNNDHVITSYAAQAASRIFQRKESSFKLKLFMYMEAPSSTEWSLDSSSKRFIPNYFIEIDRISLDVKIKALSIYEGVMRNIPHPRSKEVYESLAILRGSQAGLEYAEAYELVFELHK